MSHLSQVDEDAQCTGNKAGLLLLSIAARENCQKAINAHMKMFRKFSVPVDKSAMQETCDDFKDINLDVAEKTYQANVLSTLECCQHVLWTLHRRLLFRGWLNG